MHIDEAKSAYIVCYDELTLIAVLGQVPADWLVRVLPQNENGTDNDEYFIRADCMLERGIFGFRRQINGERRVRFEVMHNDSEFAKKDCCCEGSIHRCDEPHSWT